MSKIERLISSNNALDKYTNSSSVNLFNVGVHDSEGDYVIAQNNAGSLTTKQRLAIKDDDTMDILADTLTITSTNANDPLVEIKNTTNDANGAILKFTKDKGAAGANDDVNGIIQFFGDDANQDQLKFAEIKSQVKTATDGAEGGKLTISVAENDGTSTAGLVIEDGDADGELDVTIAAGIASLTTFAGDIEVCGSDITLGNGANSTISLKAVSGTDTAGKNLTISGGQGTGTGAGGSIIFQVADGAGSSGSSANSLATALSIADDKKVTIGGDLDVNGTTTTFTSSTASKPVIEIKNTTNDANGAILKFTKDKGAAGAANDVNGLIQFFGDDANQDLVKFCEIKSEVKVATNGQEGGKFTISVAEHDGTSTAGLVIEDGDADGELDITIGAGAASNTTIAGNLAVNGATTTFTSSTSTRPLVELKDTTDDANGAILRFTKDRGAAGAANDVNGLIQFFGDDANQDQVQFSEIKSQVKVHTNGQEGGKFTISVAEHDGTSTAGLVIEDGDADGELDVTIGAGTASLTTVNGNLTITGKLTASGGTELVHTTNTDLSDNLIVLNHKNVDDTTAANTNDSGILIDRGAANNAFMGWDESSDRFTVATTTAAGTETGNLTLTVADFHCGKIFATNVSESGTDFSQIIIQNAEDAVLQHTNDASGGEAFTIKGSVYHDNETAGSGTNSTHVSVANIQQSQIKLENDSVTLTNASTLFIENSPAVTSDSGTGSVITNAFSLYVAAGDSRFANVQATAVTTTSDISLKENVVKIDNACEKVNGMRGVYFDWKDKENYDNERQLGFIAQEVEAVVPELVKEKEGIKSVNYSQTVALLLEAIKEQGTQIKQLQDEVADLKSKVN